MRYQEWLSEGERLFGPDKRKWKFKCPVCGYVASVQEYAESGAPEGSWGYSCVGRWKQKRRDAFTGNGDGPCNYAGGGLFRLNPVHIEDKYIDMFEFAP